MTIRISLMGLRATFVVNLVLGILFWTGRDSAVGVLIHMLLGIIFVVLLWLVGIVAALRTGKISLQLTTFAIGLVIAIFGLAQSNILPGSGHAVVQVIHLLLALVGLGAAEMCSARVRRRATAKAA